jgi:hypothetical protein
LIGAAGLSVAVVAPAANGHPVTKVSAASY